MFCSFLHRQSFRFDAVSVSQGFGSSERGVRYREGQVELHCALKSIQLCGHAHMRTRQAARGPVGIHQNAGLTSSQSHAVAAGTNVDSDDDDAMDSVRHASWHNTPSSAL